MTAHPTSRAVSDTALAVTSSWRSGTNTTAVTTTVARASLASGSSTRYHVGRTQP